MLFNKIFVLLVCITLSGVVNSLISGNVRAESLSQGLEAYDFEEYRNAAKWLRPWAKRGKAEAQYKMGLMYQEGLGVRRNSKEALSWFGKAAEQGHKAAKKKLGNLRRSMASQGKRGSVALRWYQDSAELGDVEAQYNLGFIYETGLSVPRNELKATEWYELAAEQESSEAQLRLGMMYIVGAGVLASEIQGSKWIKAAANNRNGLAKLIEEKILEAPQILKIDVVEAIKKVRSIVNKSRKRAKAHILKVHQNAEREARFDKQKKLEQLSKSENAPSATDQVGIRNIEEARNFQWYKRNADLGDINAQFTLGRMFESGVNVEMNLKRGIEWYKRAADHGHVDAQYRLGIIYSVGLAGFQNKKLAQRYFLMAEKQGHIGALTLLSKAQRTQLFSKSQSTLIWWLLQSAQQGKTSAQFSLGYLYESGRGIEQDLFEANNWYSLAAAKGHLGARQRLLFLKYAKKRARQSKQIAKRSTKNEDLLTSERAPSKQNLIDQVGQSLKNIFSNTNENKSNLLSYGVIGSLIILPVAGFIYFLNKERR